MKNGFRIVLVSAIVISELFGVAHAEKHKAFGDYTTYITTDDSGVIYKQANVKLNGMLAEVVFHARSNSDKVFALVNKQKVQLIVDGSIMDHELDKNEVLMVQRARDIAVIHGAKTYTISTKGSGASMIYITDFPTVISDFVATKPVKSNSDSDRALVDTLAESSMQRQTEKKDSIQISVKPSLEVTTTDVPFWSSSRDELARELCRNAFEVAGHKSTTDKWLLSQYKDAKDGQHPNWQFILPGQPYKVCSVNYSDDVMRVLSIITGGINNNNKHILFGSDNGDVISNTF